MTTQILSSIGRLALIGEGIQISMREDKIQNGILMRPRVHGSRSKRKQTNEEHNTITFNKLADVCILALNHDKRVDLRFQNLFPTF